MSDRVFTQSNASTSRRVRAYPYLIGGVVGALVVGLLAPFLMGERTSDLSAVQATRPTDDPVSVTGSGPVMSRPSSRDSLMRNSSRPSAASASRSGVDPGGSSQDAFGTDIASENQGPEEQSSPSTELTASDVGVSAEAIRVGVFIPDTGGASQFGFDVGLGDQQAQFNAYAAEVNDGGGIHGRRLEFEFITFDPLESSSSQAACIEATEDREVFAVLNTVAFNGSAVPCLTERHGTPLLSLRGWSETLYREADGLLFTVGMGWTRIMRNAAHEMHRLGLLQGEKIGVLYTSGEANAAAVENGLFPTLEELGYEVTHASKVPVNPAQAQSQIAVAIQQMRSKGVTLVMLPINLINATTFVRQAESQGYFPLYATSDLSNGVSDGYAERMPDSFDGAVGLTSRRVGEWRVDMPERPPELRCRDVYERQTGDTLDRSSNEYGATIAACAVVDSFVDGARNAGNDLTRRSWSSGMQRIGEFEAPGSGGNSFDQEKYDSDDYMRMAKWHADCTCWLPETDFVRVSR